MTMQNTAPANEFDDESTLDTLPASESPNKPARKPRADAGKTRVAKPVSEAQEKKAIALAQRVFKVKAKLTEAEEEFEAVIAENNAFYDNLRNSSVF